MTLLERIERHLPVAEQLCERKGIEMPGRYAWFDPLSLSELREVAAALRTVAGQR